MRDSRAPSSTEQFVQRFKRQLYRLVTFFAFLVCLMGALYSQAHPLAYGIMGTLFLGSHLYLTVFPNPNLPRAEGVNLFLGTLLALYQLYTGIFWKPVALEGYWVLFTMTSLSVLAFSYQRALQVIVLQGTLGLLTPWGADLLHHQFNANDRLYLISMQVLVLAAMSLQSAVAWFKEQFYTAETHRQVLEQQAWTDPLTGLHNRRSTLRTLEEALQRPRTATVILLDIDHFKSINDRFGHNTGDEVLRGVARLLHLKVRGEDHVGRWGGEEFLLILPNTCLQDALLVAEKIREALQEHPFETVGQVTASLGVATHQASESVQEWVNRADQALYQSKQTGRNRVSAHPFQTS